MPDDLTISPEARDAAQALSRDLTVLGNVDREVFIGVIAQHLERFGQAAIEQWTRDRAWSTERYPG